MVLVVVLGVYTPPPPQPPLVKQEKSCRGSADATKTRSSPQRVRMSSGERPIGAAKGKKSDTEALCQIPPPPMSDSAASQVCTHYRPGRRLQRLLCH